MTCRKECAFDLALHPDKTRLIRFGRHAAKQREKLGEGKPERASLLGEVHPARRPLLPANQGATPAALSPLRRQNPREEPGALAAHAGICAAGEEQPSSLPRP
jgi:hypothetical protein